MAISYTGHCYCGEIRFAIKSDVVPNKTVFCHCDSCRRAHSAPLYYVSYIPSDCFEITAGAELVRFFSKADDSPMRAFCGNCGSRVYNIVQKKPALGIGFFPALLDEAIQHNLPDEFKPEYHYHSAETILPLDCIHDGLERK